MKIEKAILAAGCFWGVEELIREVPGVVSTVVGYTGGDVANATYRNHGTHAEGIEISFDPEKLPIVSYWSFSSRSMIQPQGTGKAMMSGHLIVQQFSTLDEEQKEVATALIAELTASKIWSRPIVTEVVPAREFWVAEEEHQSYLQKHPYGYTCHYVRPEWAIKADSPV